MQRYVSLNFHTLQVKPRGLFIAWEVGEAVGEAVTTEMRRGGAGRPGSRPSGPENRRIHRLSSSHGPYCLPRSVAWRLWRLECVSSSTVDLHLCFFLSRRIEVPRIADFTNPSAGSTTWLSLPVLDVVLSAIGLHKCVDTSLECM
jgi:hypothetical protein